MKTQAGARTLSVAMCTYNGERYLQQQLASILRQSRLPDSMVIRDDGSTDATPAMLAAFAQQAPFPVDCQVNPKNLGSTRNFEQAIAACRGELIALCDQDDVWHPHRLERCERELLNQPEVGLVFSDADIIDDDGRHIGPSLWENFAFERTSIDALLAGDVMPMTKRAFVTGATVMFRARYAALCFPAGKRWLHDGWLAMLIACMASIRPIEEKLLSYRLHRNQQVGLKPDTLDHDASASKTPTREAPTVAFFHANIQEICDAIERLPLTAEQRSHGPAQVFLRHRDFLAMRLALPADRLARLPIVLNAMEQYRVSANGVLSMVKDVLLPKAP